MRDTFSTFHPAVNFAYFSAVITISMFYAHPIFLIISLAAAFVYSFSLNGVRAVKFNLLFVLPMILAVSIINPLFNHAGVTILGYIGNNPVTKESIIYGINSGLMLASVIVWFSCYNAVMTSDKFIYLFGRIAPSLSLLFSMVLRFIPRFKAQIRKIADAQKCVGRDAGNGTIIQRAGHGMKILSVMVTWALENSIDTADSMRARGYGLQGRTTFSIFRFDTRDTALLLCIGISSLAVAAGAYSESCLIRYFPSFKIEQPSAFGILCLGAFLFLCAIPVLLDIKEELKWKRSRHSK